MGMHLSGVPAEVRERAAIDAGLIVLAFSDVDLALSEVLAAYGGLQPGLVAGPALHMIDVNRKLAALYAITGHMKTSGARARFKKWKGEIEKLKVSRDVAAHGALVHEEGKWAIASLGLSAILAGNWSERFVRLGEGPAIAARCEAVAEELRAERDKLAAYHAAKASRQSAGA